MENTALNDIKNYAINRLKQEYGYCGVAENTNMAMLNSSGDCGDIVIKIEQKQETT